MTFDEFVDLVPEMQGMYPEWRAGQAAFNTLLRYRPDLAERVKATNLDPFYQDAQLADFYLWLKDTWDEIEIARQV